MTEGGKSLVRFARHYYCAPVPTPEHVDLPPPGEGLHLGHGVPGPGVADAQLAVLVPPEGPEGAALGEADREVR